MINTLLNSFHSTQLSIDERTSIIAEHPLFCLLSPKHMQHLAQLAEEISVPMGTMIVEEGAIVDKVYLIAAGQAKVTRTMKTVEKNHMMQLATLNKGDAIGLTATGFYSQTGIRVATVTATSPMILLSFNINEFYHFLSNPEITYPGLKNFAEKILLMQFLEATTLFSHLHKQHIYQIAKKIKKISIKAGTILFKQNDHADKCYYILSGKVSVNAYNNQTNRLLKILETSAIFGEGALIEKAKRNATVKAETDCELFMLEPAALSIPKNDRVFSETLGKLRTEQIRPMPEQDVSIEKRKTLHGNEAFILNKKTAYQPIRLSEQEYAIWKNFDGTQTLLDILDKVCMEFPALTMDELYQFTLKLNKMGLVDFIDADALKEKRSAILAYYGLKMILNSWMKHKEKQ